MSRLSPMVRFDGQSLAQEWQLALIEVRVEKQFQVPSRVTIRFTDPGYALLSRSSVKLGTVVEVLSPDGDELAAAEVTAITCEQRPGEQPELGIEALDKSHRLGRDTTVKVYQATKYSDIVRQLALDLGLELDIDQTEETLDYLMQAESGMALITEAARRTGYDWWVDSGVFHFKRPSPDGARVRLTLGADLRSFSARASGLQPSTVVVDGWDRTTQKLVTASVEEGSVPRPDSKFADLVKPVKAAFGSASVVSVGLGVMSVPEARALAQSVLDRAVASAVTAKGTADGDAGVKLGATVEVSGAGPMTGDYPVTAVEHLYRPSTGFVTRFASGERRPTTLVDTLAGGAAVAAYGGPAHLRGGLTVGKVTSNKDEKNMGRVRVRYPGMSSEAESDWARVLTVGGGKDRGSVWIPEVDDEVLVGFEGGDARRPVVIGGLFGDTSTIPQIEIQDGKVQSRAMTSRLGHVIAFLDGSTPDKQAIELQLAGKNTAVHLGKDKVTVTAPGGTPVEITAGETSVKFSKSGDASIEATNINLKAKAKISLQAPQIAVQADTTLDMKSSLEAKLSGNILEMQGQTVAKLAGGIVAIN